ncbi:MAG: hypothetical protein UY32_C0017G0003 [Candidatus Jorgensenbacteria bacterium GW2011_GWC1_48_8]|nr:MAG: hypothetical protein UY32_C0017G0003 [Candidatus Jorgensenbacteria bacterium GW2011_GWC1_48_8]
MRKVFLVAIGLVFLTPAASLAASNFSFTPSSGSYEQGQVFTVQIFVDPQGVSLYTVKAKVKYPADILEIKSFTFSGPWIPLVQSDYDLIDNTQGVLIKTGGYPGGLSSRQSLGTINFRVRKAGSASLNFGSDSVALDVSNNNSLSSSLQQAIFDFAVPKLPASAPAISEAAPAAVEQAEQTIPVALETPLNPLSLAVVSVLAPLNPLILLGVALASLIAVLLLKRKHKHRKIKIFKK